MGFDERITKRDQLAALYEVWRYRPVLAVLIIVLSIIAAALEGIGLGFILPIIEMTQSNSDPSGPVRLFAALYGVLGVPFVLEYIVAGVTVTIGVRYLAAFAAAWLTAALQMQYIRMLRTEAFKGLLEARIPYFDETGSDEVINAVTTQTNHAADGIYRFMVLLKLLLVSLAYVLVALYVAPSLMLATAVILGASLLAVRGLFESGYSVGDRVADANERLQTAIQASTQGIRDVKLFGVDEYLLEEYRSAVDQFTRSKIAKSRNQAAINNASHFATAVFVFGLLYAGIEVASLSLASLGVFLFAIFRLGPKVSQLNTIVYELESDLPHLVRTQTFTQQVRDQHEPGGSRPAPDTVEAVSFESVSFAYEDDESVLEDVSFDVSCGEFIAFAGPSGAGKSTIASLLARMYEPDSGEVTANGTPIQEFNVKGWRDRISLVRQNPFVFNDTLAFNVRVGNDDASWSDIERVCELAKVDEFVGDLPEGYETMLGDDGVRLSGGQRQRVAVARALLKDADLLLLDEATSDLDTRLEREVHEGIERYDPDCAVVAIAHRLSTITHADRIHVVENGRLVETGSHHELLECGEMYASLYRSQVGAVPE